MGRISLPHLNKAGHSMFWDSMWDDKHNYTKLLNNNIFIHTCIPLIFDDYSNVNLLFLIKKNNNLDDNIIKYRIFMRNVAHNKINVYNSLKKNKSLSFLSKTWILKYQSWIILYMYIYISNIENKIAKLRFPLSSEYLYQHIYFNYYYNLQKFNYNNEFYSYKLIKKNTF